MKKLLSLILALAMVMSLSVTAFAAEDKGNADNDTVSITLTGKYVAGGTTAAEVVSVDVAWGAMEFTYTGAGVYWDPADHTTKSHENAEWSASGNNITVTNHSNVGITAGFAFASDVVTGKFYDAAENGTEKNAIALERAAEGSELTSQQGTVYFVVESGEISADTSALGTITVTISKTTT